MRIVIVHPGLGSGGSEARVLKLIEFLQKDHQVTLLTGRPFECDRLNQSYHTAVDPRRLAVELAPMPNWLRSARVGDALRGAFVERHVRQATSGFDLCIGAYNFAPFGRPAIQFIADFSWDDEIRRAYDPVSPGLRGVMQRPTPLRWAYLTAADVIAGGRVDMHAHRRDIIIANSRWTADMLECHHGLKPRVIYPPVHVPPLGRMDQRSGDFVLLGRISPEKRVTEAIGVLARVRQRRHDFNLHIIGPLDGSAYSELVCRRAGEVGSWIKLHGARYGDAKFVELGQHSFGLHMRRREAFGIAIVEMIKMGLIPFVPARSAPAEILADERLTFDNEDHAVEVIDRLLRAPNELAAIRQGLAVRAKLFAAETFVAEVRAVVAEQFVEQVEA